MSRTDARRVVVLDVIGLQPEHLGADRTPNLYEILDYTTHLRPPFPAVTVPSQTTLSTGRSPAEHGDVASGEYDRTDDEVEFWGRDRSGRERLWETASEDAGLTTGALFFQHLVGTTADVAVTPSPIEDEDNNMLEMNCWTNPDGLYDDLREEYGHFPLHAYWGPGANETSSEWILTAAADVVERYDPDMLWVYVPHLDYEGLRTGPDGERFASAIETVDGLVGDFLDTLRADDRWADTVVNVVSEYGFHAVDTPVFPNRALRDAGLLEMRLDADGEPDVDLESSEAFTLVDHQIAHVYADETAVDDVRDAIGSLDGIEEILDRADRVAYGVDHPNAGDLVLIAEPYAWFQYYWWRDREEAPSYADSVDIHRKPGFDPCELFVGETGLASMDPTQVGGSHGRVDDRTMGCYGLGGPAVPDVRFDDPVDARAVAPTIAAIFGIESDLRMGFDVPPVGSL